MVAIPCTACGGKMNAEVVACPHCGARRAGGGLTAGKLSNDEIRALLVTTPSLGVGEPSRGLLPTLVLPHPATTGAARTAELVLTVIGLPLVAIGALSLSLMRGRRKAEPAAGEVVPALAMTVFGGSGLYELVQLLGASGSAVAIVVGGSLAALWTRAVIRIRSGGARSRELTRVRG